MTTIDERARQEGLPARIILKEALQVAVLDQIYFHPESGEVTFQGGSCLRLLYGGPRYSEDLDFVVPETRVLKALFGKVRPAVERLGPIFQARLWMRVLKETDTLVRWKLYCGEREDRPAASIAIEFARFPAYTMSLLPVRVPAGMPAAPFILARAEEREEILADKVSAVAGRAYLKGRDLFDIWFLRTGGVKVDMDLVRRKLADYSVPRGGIEKRIAGTGQEAVARDLRSYLPRRYRDKFEEEGYRDVLNAAAAVAREVDRKLRRGKT
jgi:predicted nucleotidyltransferase component of viral defense system